MAFQPVGLFVGKGANAIEVAVARSGQAPTRTALLESWKDWADARRKAEAARGRRDRDLLAALGFRVEKLDNLTHLLRSDDRRPRFAPRARRGPRPATTRSLRDPGPRGALSRSLLRRPERTGLVPSMRLLPLVGRIASGRKLLEERVRA